MGRGSRQLAEHHDRSLSVDMLTLHAKARVTLLTSRLFTIAYICEHLMHDTTKCKIM